MVFGASQDKLMSDDHGWAWNSSMHPFLILARKINDRHGSIYKC